jgi:predicted AAA+ superfamily ATPase
MLEIFAPAAERFIAATIGSDPRFADWTALVAVKDRQNGITGQRYAKDDPQLLLRMLTENIPHQVSPGWFPFDQKLSKVHKSYASELRDVRDSWAHHGTFSDDDAYRALDTAERLLVAMGAGPAADEVSKIRLNLRRVTSAKADQRTLRTVVSNPESKGLRPWREVLRPHDDVATGNFQAAEFAADLYKVAHSDEAGRDYADPVQFFARTYLTEGLRDLLGRAVRRLAGDDNASPVINLQTNFGGGKTHSMLSLWHLASGMPLGDLPQDLQDLLAGTRYRELDPVHRVALVGNHLSTTGSVKPDGTRVNTVWGELAWQLGGHAAYEIVRTADEKRTPPGPALHELLTAYTPAVILMDEWVAYARSLVGRDDLEGGTFDDQFTFAQSLTEAVKGTRGVLLAISIPASESGDDSGLVAGNAEEVGGAHGLEALKRLQNVVRRVADQWRPASADEAYHIVRQRLFVAADAEALAAIGATARAYVELYRKHSGDFPRESHDPAYEERIKRTYPIHPEVFDRLYEDWSSLERFQRTRGVLRLMNKIIHALWVGADQSPLIMPGSIPIAASEVNAEIAQYLQDSWKAIIDADVDGPNSEPALIDNEKPLFGQRSLTKRLARTVFFGSAPRLGAAHKGLETQRVFLGTATPGDVPGNFHSALTQLGDRATYFYSGSGKFWYDLQANISRRAKDHAERMHREEVWAEIVRRLDGGTPEST